MDTGVVLIIGVLIAMIIVCLLLKQNSSAEKYYDTQPYYPYYYGSGYGSSYPWVAYGYKGPGSKDYPGYGPAFNYQKQADCKLGCVTKYEYGHAEGDSIVLNNCLAACAKADPYGFKKGM